MTDFAKYPETSELSEVLDDLQYELRRMKDIFKVCKSLEDEGELIIEEIPGSKEIKIRTVQEEPTDAIKEIAELGDSHMPITYDHQEDEFKATITVSLL